MKIDMFKIQRTIIICIILISALSTNAQTIHINTNNMSLVYNVSNSKLYQLHFGPVLSSLKGIEYTGLIYNEAYPSFGNGQSDEVALIATHADGSIATDLVYKKHTQTTSDNIQTTTIQLQDERKPFYVELNFKAYQKENVIEQWVKIHHKDKGNIRLEQFASSAIGFKAESYYLTHFYGGWAKEMMMVEEQLTNGTKCIETKRGVRSTEYENPSFILSLNQKAQENNGEVYMGALAWSGNFKFGFQVDDQERCQMIAGINPFASDYLISSSDTFLTPRMILTYSNSGKNAASINLHRWSRKYNLRDGDQRRPVVLNSWEGAYFDFDETKIKNMMDGASEMGVEMFVLDDGWFGNKYPRNSDKAGLGDWQVNKKKLPNGIGSLIDHAESKGLKFGIWVEPEMVNPKSELAENHPDWIIQRMNGREMLLERNQLLLDLSNPKVQDFVFNVVHKLLVENPRIAYIKWDANRHLQNFGSTYLETNQQSHLWIDYTKGLGSVIERLTTKHPQVIFQACASGGGRVDFGALKYMHEFWASDNTDAYDRLFIQWGTNHIYPPIATGAHIVKSPGHQTRRQIPLKFRCDVAMGGRLGLELQPSNLKKEDILFTKSVIDSYKKYRHIIQFGDLYRLQSPYDNDGFASIKYVTQNKNEAIAMVYSHEFHRRNERNLLKLKGLDENGIYRVVEINKISKKSTVDCEGMEISGSILMNTGIKVDLKKPYTSLVLYLEKIEN
ncbi:alpha-galactosidase [Labilibacter sediminis]|nr:alpha-galactosidase [Labilibacter sediminis]